MMRTTKKRRKISSAAELREEDGVGQRGPGSDRSHHSPAAAWEALAVALAEAAPVARAVAPVMAAVHPRARRPVDLELEALRGTPAAPHSAPAQPRRGVPQVRGAARRRQKARRSPPGGENLEAGSLPARERRVSRGREVGRRPGRQAVGRAGGGRRGGENPPPSVGAVPGPEGPPGPADAAAAAKKLGHGVAPGGRFFCLRAQFPRRGYSQVAALFLDRPSEE